MHLITQLIILSICLWLAATNPAGKEGKKEKVKTFLINKSYVKKHPESLLLKTPKYRKYIETHKVLDKPILLPVFTVKKQLKRVHESKSMFFKCEDKSGECKAKPETHPRNISEAWPEVEQPNKYFINLSNCETICSTFKEVSFEDCIFEGVLDDDPGSTVLVTGCPQEDNCVQINSKKFGNHIFTTDVFTNEARALEFDEDDYDYDDAEYDEEYEDEFFFKF